MAHEIVFPVNERNLPDAKDSSVCRPRPDRLNFLLNYQPGLRTLDPGSPAGFRFAPGTKAPVDK
jgi:hypothetical protein